MISVWDWVSWIVCTARNHTEEGEAKYPLLFTSQRFENPRTTQPHNQFCRWIGLSIWSRPLRPPRRDDSKAYRNNALINSFRDVRLPDLHRVWCCCRAIDCVGSPILFSNNEKRSPVEPVWDVTMYAIVTEFAPRIIARLLRKNQACYSKNATRYLKKIILFCRLIVIFSHLELIFFFDKLLLNKVHDPITA